MPLRIEPRFLSLVAHDLRNPLNVIGLSLRMIEEELPADSPDVREDIEILRQNANQLARMLSFLSDFSRQIDDGVASEPAQFDPVRVAEEAAEEAEAEARLGRATVRVRVEAGKGCPKDVTLDPVRSRVALRYALINAVESASGSPIRVSIAGFDNRLIIAITIERPPLPTVRSVALRGDIFERVQGNESERLGLDLAIAARACELLGGSAKLEVAEGRSSSIVLEWPAKNVTPR
jgi:signal transduction histidine kinase